MKSYSFKEYKLISENDYTLIEKFLNNLKINKKEYKKIIILITIFMNKNLISYCMTTRHISKDRFCIATKSSYPVSLKYSIGCKILSKIFIT